MLEWNLRNWKKLQHLEVLMKQKEAGLSVPFLDNMPTVHPHNAWVMQGYTVLSTQRLKIDGRPQPIQISEIKAYADYVGMADEGDREDFLWLVLRMDATALDFADAEAARQSRKNEMASKRGARGARTSGRKR